MEVDLASLGRRELQVLAKKHGLKANMKSILIREKLAEVLGHVSQDKKTETEEKQVFKGDRTVSHFPTSEVDVTENEEPVQEQASSTPAAIENLDEPAAIIKREPEDEEQLSIPSAVAKDKVTNGDTDESVAAANTNEFAPSVAVDVAEEKATNGTVSVDQIEERIDEPIKPYDYETSPKEAPTGDTEDVQSIGTNLPITDITDPVVLPSVTNEASQKTTGSTTGSKHHVEILMDNGFDFTSEAAHDNEITDMKDCPKDDKQSTSNCPSLQDDTDTYDARETDEAVVAVDVAEEKATNGTVSVDQTEERIDESIKLYDYATSPKEAVGKPTGDTEDVQSIGANLPITDITDPVAPPLVTNEASQKTTESANVSKHHVEILMDNGFEFTSEASPDNEITDTNGFPEDDMQQSTSNCPSLQDDTDTYDARDTDEAVVAVDVAEEKATNGTVSVDQIEERIDEPIKPYDYETSPKEAVGEPTGDTEDVQSIGTNLPITDITDPVVLPLVTNEASQKTTGSTTGSKHHVEILMDNGFDFTSEAAHDNEITDMKDCPKDDKQSTSNCPSLQDDTDTYDARETDEAVVAVDVAEEKATNGTVSVDQTEERIDEFIKLYDYATSPKEAVDTKDFPEDDKRSTSNCPSLQDDTDTYDARDTDEAVVAVDVAEEKATNGTVSVDQTEEKIDESIKLYDYATSPKEVVEEPTTITEGVQSIGDNLPLTDIEINQTKEADSISQKYKAVPALSAPAKRTEASKLVDAELNTIQAERSRDAVTTSTSMEKETGEMIPVAEQNHTTPPDVHKETVPVLSVSSTPEVPPVVEMFTKTQVEAKEDAKISQRFVENETGNASPVANEYCTTSGKIEVESLMAKLLEEDTPGADLIKTEPAVTFPTQVREEVVDIEPRTVADCQHLNIAPDEAGEKVHKPCDSGEGTGGSFVNWNSGSHIDDKNAGWKRVFLEESHENVVEREEKDGMGSHYVDKEKFAKPKDRNSVDASNMAEETPTLNVLNPEASQAIVLHDHVTTPGGEFVETDKSPNNSTYDNCREEKPDARDTRGETAFTTPESGLESTVRGDCRKSEQRPGKEDGDTVTVARSWVTRAKKPPEQQMVENVAVPTDEDREADKLCHSNTDERNTESIDDKRVDGGKGEVVEQENSKSDSNKVIAPVSKVGYTKYPETTGSLSMRGAMGQEAQAAKRFSMVKVSRNKRTSRIQAPSTRTTFSSNSKKIDNSQKRRPLEPVRPLSANSQGEKVKPTARSGCQKPLTNMSNRRCTATKQINASESSNLKREKWSQLALERSKGMENHSGVQVKAKRTPQLAMPLANREERTMEKFLERMKRGRENRAEKLVPAAFHR